MRHLKFRQPLHVGREPTLLTFTEWHYWGFINGEFVPPELHRDSVEHAYRYSEQSTDFADKNEAEIFEGDTLRWNDGIGRPECQDSLWRVIWKEGAFTLEYVVGGGKGGTDTPFFKPSWKRNMEIVANRYQVRVLEGIERKL